MSVTVRLLNRDIPAEQVKINIQQNKIGTIKCSIPIVDYLTEYGGFTAARNAMRYQAIAVYQDGSLIRSGVVKEVIPASMGKLPGYAEVVAEDEFGWLGLIWSKWNAHYQDNLLTTALEDLLTYAEGWELGDTSTMLDETVTIAVNLRSKERLWPQIVAAVEAAPGVFLR
ncbi:MAG: hypothetical protein KC496_17915, partial [Anaerolineae bacterium]|nr:hypothetical protein [Anaerolineae bacterium]